MSSQLLHSRRLAKTLAHWQLARRTIAQGRAVIRDTRCIVLGVPSVSFASDQAAEGQASCFQAGGASGDRTSYLPSPPCSYGACCGHQSPAASAPAANMPPNIASQQLNSPHKRKKKGKAKKGASMAAVTAHGSALPGPPPVALRRERKSASVQRCHDIWRQSQNHAGAFPVCVLL